MSLSKLSLLKYQVTKNLTLVGLPIFANIFKIRTFSTVNTEIKELTVRDALNAALDEEIARDDRVFFNW